VGVVLTIAAAGSEMSCGSVVTKDEGGVKRAYDDDLSRPKFAVMNPELTMTLPTYQTFSGIADILMHTMERWFNQADNMDMTDEISAALMKNVMKHARVLVGEPDNYASRAEIMWAGSLSHNGLTGCATGGGDWASHNMEHELGGLYDVAHGAGLAAVWPSWARYVWKAAPHRFYKFAVNVMGVEAGEEAATIEAGIQAMEAFYHETGMPINLTELGVAPTDAEIEHMAKSCYEACGGPAGCIKPLEVADMIEIYKNAR
jgi:alcohol dehydrogenase YqhD (iron-dependent ADH family)